MAIRTYLEEINLGLLVGHKESCEEKTRTLETIIKTGMDTLLRPKSKTVIANEPPWINKQLNFPNSRSSNRVLLVVKGQVFVPFGIVLTAYVSPVALNTTSPKLNIWEISLLVGGGMKLKGSVGCNQLHVLTRLQSWNVLTQGLTLVLRPLLIPLTTRSSPLWTPFLHCIRGIRWRATHQSANSY